MKSNMLPITAATERGREATREREGVSDIMDFSTVFETERIFRENLRAQRREDLDSQRIANINTQEMLEEINQTNSITLEEIHNEVENYVEVQERIEASLERRTWVDRIDNLMTYWDSLTYAQQIALGIGTTAGTIMVAYIGYRLVTRTRITDAIMQDEKKLTLFGKIVDHLSKK